MEEEAFPLRFVCKQSDSSLFRNCHIKWVKGQNTFGKGEILQNENMFLLQMRHGGFGPADMVWEGELRQ